MHLTISRAILCAYLSLGFISTIGCTSAMVSTPMTTSSVAVGGNWQFSSSDVTAVGLPVISGELSGTSTAITGILHANSASACVSSKTSFAVTGSADKNNFVILTASDVAGGTLVLSGTLATDGKSLSNASYTVNGGSCAFAKPATMSAQSYAQIAGTYKGNFVDGSGNAIAITASLTQTPQADTNGNFTLSGSGSFTSNPCFNSPVSVSNTLVTGGSFSMTYADQQTGNSVTGNGTFSTDGTTLTLTGWTLTGPCGPEQGTGTLTKQ